MTNQKLRRWEAALLMALGVTLLVGGYSAASQGALAESVLRLHVVANSDSAFDQEAKLQVRDAVLAAARPLMAGAASSTEAEACILPHLEELAQVARDTLAQFGSSHPVQVTVEDQWFPTKEYDTFSLPAGNYRALRVVIGAGKGQNWWCVVFPPLCLGSVTEDVAAEAMAAGLSEDQAALITGQDGGYVLKFKVIEWWELLVKKFEK